MLVLRGPLAHSHFRMERWLSHINHRVPQVTALVSEYIHFLDLESLLNDSEHNILSSFLNYGSFLTEIRADFFKGLQIVVVPKFNSQSSWSSKATHLLQLCQLNKVKKLERGIIYYISVSEKITNDDAKTIANLLHDSLTEAVFYDLEAAENALKEQSVDEREQNDQNKQALSIYSSNLSGNKVNVSLYHLRHLNIPGFEQPWDMAIDEKKDEKDKRTGINALQTLIELPVEVARFYHETGCLNIGGYLRTDNSNSDLEPLVLNKIQLENAIFRLLRFPVIADKSYLTTISDRFLTGKVVRDSLIGPWQVAVSDYHLMLLNEDLNSYQGTALALGERSPLGYLNPEASIRMSIGEAITNIAGVDIADLSRVKLKLYIQKNNDHENRIEILKQATEVLSKSLGIELDFELESGVVWNVAAIVETEVLDVRKCLSPMLVQDPDPTFLIFIDLSDGHQRMAESCLAQAFNQKGEFVPDLNNPALLKIFFKVIQQLKSSGKILAYHDRSNGGLFVTLCEMAFAGHIGIEVDVSELGRNSRSILFNEELGAVIQVRGRDVEGVLVDLAESGITNSYLLGTLDGSDKITIIFNEEPVCAYDRVVLQKAWSETSYCIQTLRDNPRCAKKQYDQIEDKEDPGINTVLTFDPKENRVRLSVDQKKKPLVAILIEEGVFHHEEIVTIFRESDFDCELIEMSALHSGQENLSRFKGLAISGGFSFGDVLGAGKGWAKRILFHANLRGEFERFFNRADTFTIGISNGCQMLSSLRMLIPGTEYWPTFIQNYSEQFESRWCLVEIQKTVSPFFEGMVGSRLAVPISHQEGRIEFENENIQDEAIKKGLVVLRYVDNHGRKTKVYPANPSGSPLGITGLTSEDGRVLMMMPHPERALRSIQYPDYQVEWGNLSPWLRLFQNIRIWVDS